MRRLLWSWVLLATGIALTAALVPGIHVSGGVTSYLWIAVVFGAVNLVLKPILQLLSAPLLIVTLGLFSLVINAALLALVAWLVDDLSVDGIVAALSGALAISILGMISGSLRSDRAPRPEGRQQPPNPAAAR